MDSKWLCLCQETWPGRAERAYHGSVPLWGVEDPSVLRDSTATPELVFGANLFKHVIRNSRAPNMHSGGNGGGGPTEAFRYL